MTEVWYKIRDESYKFAIMIVNCCSRISRKNKEYVLTRQLLKSGTSIWANIREAQDAQSKKDFLHKMNISLKEAKETQYWLCLLKDAWYGNYIWLQTVDKVNEMVGILTRIIKTVKASMKK
jgi:four helix bundle protein